MKGLRVKCCSCGKVMHETTDKYKPDVTPNGSMVQLLNPWKGWRWSAFDDEVRNISSTPANMMCCPSCSAPLVKNGRLTIINDIKSRAAMNQAAIYAVDLEGNIVLPMNHDDEEMLKEMEIEHQQGLKNLRKAKVVNGGKAIRVPLETVKDDELTCKICGKICKSPLGLLSHSRSHKDK